MLLKRVPLKIKLLRRGLILLSFSFCFLPFSIINAQGTNRRDPFMPLVTSDGRLIKLDVGENTTGLLVEGLIHDQQGVSLAIVNGNVVKIGDITSNGYQVLKIEQNKVIFIKDGEILEVEIKKEDE